MAKKKEQHTVSGNREQRLDIFKASIQKLYGDNHVVNASEEANKKRLIPSGSLQLDILLGGGYRVGAIHMSWGWESSGKTTTALMALAQAQKMCSKCYTQIRPTAFDGTTDPKWMKGRRVCASCYEPYHVQDRPYQTYKEYYEGGVPDGVNPKDTYCSECGCGGTILPLAADDEWIRPTFTSCECGSQTSLVALYIDTEGKLDFEWAKTLGVNLDLMIYERPGYGEAALDVLREAVKTGAADVIIIDSLANLAMSAEVDASMQNDHMATTAKKLNSVMRQLPGLMMNSRQDHGVEITLFAIQQVREKIGLFGGHTMFGGHGQKFAATTILKYDRAKNEIDEFQVGTKEKSEILGVSLATNLSVTCLKNGSAPTAGRSTAFRLMQINDGILRAGEVEDYDMLWKYAKACGLIARPEGSDKGWAVLGRTYRTEGELKIALHIDRLFKFDLERVIIKMMLDDWIETKAALEDNGKKKKGE